MKNNILIIIAVAVLTSCGNKKNAETTIKNETPKQENVINLTPEQVKIADIQLGSLAEEEFHHQISCNGVVALKPNSIATVSLPFEGTVKKINIQEGNEVQKGTILLTMQHPNFIDLQTQYLTMLSEYDYLQKEYERQKKLNDQQAISDKIYQKTKSEYKIQKANLSGISAKLKMIGINPTSISEGNIKTSISVKAPISGYVGDLDIQLGEIISPNDAMLKLINNKNICLELEVFVQHKNALEIGQTVNYNLSGNKSEKHLAVITSIGQTVDTHKKTIKVIAKPMQNETLLASGSFIEAQIGVQGKISKILPKEAVVTKSGESNIFISTSPNTFKKIPVDIIGTSNGHLAINFIAETASENIVIKGANYLVE